MVRVSSDSQSTGLESTSHTDQSQGRGVGDGGMLTAERNRSGSPFPVHEV